MLKKSTRVILSFLFLLQTISPGISSEDANPLVMNKIHSDPWLNIPSRWGHVQEKWNAERALDPTSKGAKFVIHIQDVHNHFEAQSNTAKILRSLLRPRGKESFRLVELEGGTGNLDSSLLSSIPDPQLRKELANALLRLGKISGAEFLSIIEPDIARLRGPEDPKLYFKNLLYFRQNLDRRDQIVSYLDVLLQQLKQIQTKIETPQLKRLSDTQDRFSQGKLSLEDYLNFLKIERGKLELLDPTYPNLDLFSKANDLNRRIDFAAVQKEHQKVLEELPKRLKKSSMADLLAKTMYYRLDRLPAEFYFGWLRDTVVRETSLDPQDYSHLWLYMDYLEIFERVDKEELFAEAERLFAEIRRTYANTEDQKKLYENLDWIRILRNLHCLELTREDYLIFKKGSGALKLEAILDYIGSHEPVVNGIRPSEDKLRAIEESAREAEVFYETAQSRDKVLVENTLAEMDSRGLRVAVLVAGGFHTQGIVEQLKRRGVGYVVVAPRITKFKAKTPYLSLMQDERLPLEASVESVGKKKLARLSHGPTERNISVVANLPATQSFEPLRDLLAAGLPDDLRSLVFQKMKTLTLFNMISLAYLEVAIVLEAWNDAKDQKDFEAIKPLIQNIFSKWLEGYVETSRHRSSIDIDSLSLRNRFTDLNRGFEVLDVERIGNRVFLTISVFGQTRGMILDPRLKGDHLIRTISNVQLLDLRVFGLLKRAQTLIHSQVGEGNKITLSMLEKIDPEFGRLRDLLVSSSFPLIELQEERTMARISQSQTRRLRDVMMDPTRLAADRIQAAADLLELINQSGRFQDLLNYVHVFLSELQAYVFYFGSLSGKGLLSPISINPFKKLYTQLPAGSGLRFLIEDYLFLIQSMLIIRDQDQEIVRITYPSRLLRVRERIKEILSLARGSSDDLIILNPNARPLRADLFRNVLDSSPRILNDADMDLSNSTLLLRSISHKHPRMEVVGADKILFGYIVRDKLGNSLLFSKEGEMLPLQSSFDFLQGRLTPHQIHRAKILLANNLEHLNRMGRPLQAEEFTVEPVSFISPSAEEILKISPHFSAVQRDALSPPQKPVAIRTNLNHLLAYHVGDLPDVNKLSQYLSRIGSQMPDGALFIIGNGGRDELIYWIFQRVDDQLILVDHSTEAERSAWHGVLQTPVSVQMGPPAGMAYMCALPILAVMTHDPVVKLAVLSGTAVLSYEPLVQRSTFFREMIMGLKNLFPPVFRFAKACFQRISKGFDGLVLRRIKILLGSVFLGLTVLTAHPGKALADEPPPVFTTEIFPRPERFANPFGMEPLSLRPISDPFRGNELAFGMAFNQGTDYRLRLDHDISNAWRFHFLHSRSGIYNDTLDHVTLQMIEDNALLLGLFTGYISPFERARAHRELPIGSSITRMGFGYRRPNSPFWLRLNAGVGGYELPVLYGDRYRLQLEEVRPFGGIDLGLDYRFLERPWHTLHWQIELGAHYQEILRDRLYNPEGIDSTHLTTRVWSDFDFLGGRLRLTPLMETGFDPQSIMNVYFRGLQMPDGATNDQIASEVIGWGTRYGGIMTFPYDDRGGAIDPTDLLGLAEHGVIRFVSTPVIWHTIEGRVTATPWNFLQFRASGGVHLAWRPEITFRMADVRASPGEVLDKNYLEDEWHLFFDPIPFVSTGVSGLILRELRADFDWRGLWTQGLPISSRFTGRIRWQPSLPWLRGTELDVYYRHSNYSEPFGTLQSLRPESHHNFGFNLKYRWSPIRSKKGSNEPRKIASVNRDKDGSVKIDSVHTGLDEAKGNWLRRLYEGVKHRTVELFVEKTLQKFREKYPRVNLDRFKFFLFDSKRLGGILHSESLDREVHLHQSLFPPWRIIWSKILSGLSLGRYTDKLLELTTFNLAHEAIRHPLVDVEHSDFLVFSQAFPQLREHYESGSSENQDILRELLEEAIVVYGDVEDFLGSTRMRQDAILEGLARTESKNERGGQTYGKLLNHSRDLKRNEFMPEIVKLLVNDPRFEKVIPHLILPQFVQMADHLAQRWFVLAQAYEVASEGPTRRDVVVKGFKATLFFLYGMALKACGFPANEAWDLNRREKVTISEDDPSYSVSAVEGATVSIQPGNTVDAQLSTDPTILRGSHAAFVATSDPSLEPNPENRQFNLFFHLATSTETTHPIFSEARNLLQYEHNVFEYVTNGISHALHFEDVDGVTYDIPINIPDADPNQYYRIKIEELVKALLINGLKVGDTNLTVSVPAGPPFVIIGWAPNPVTAPMLTGKSGRNRRTVARGLIQNGRFAWMDPMSLDETRTVDFANKINEALSLLAKLRNISDRRVPMVLTEDNNHFLDFTGHIGIDTDFLKGAIYSPHLLALLLDHELAHALDETRSETKAIVSNLEIYAALKDQNPHALSPALIKRYPYLAFLDRAASLKPSERESAAEKFVQDHPDLFALYSNSHYEDAEELLTRVTEQFPEWHLPQIDLGLVGLLKKHLIQEAEETERASTDHSFDLTLLGAVEQLATEDALRWTDLRNLASMLITARATFGGRELSSIQRRNLETDLVVLLAQIFGYARGVNVSDRSLRNTLLSEDRSELESTRLEDLMEEWKSEVFSSDEGLSEAQLYRIDKSGKVFINRQEIKNLSHDLIQHLRVSVRKVAPGQNDIVLRFSQGIPFSQERIRQVIAALLANPEKISSGFQIAGFLDGSLVKVSLEENRLTFELVSLRQRWAQIYDQFGDASWQRLRTQLQAPEARERPPVKVVILGADGMGVKLVKGVEGHPKWDVDPSRFMELYRETRGIAHPVLPGSMIKWVIPILVDENLTTSETKELERLFREELFASRPGWMEESQQNVLVQIIGPPDRNAGEALLRRVEKTLLKGQESLDHRRDLMLILSEREKNRLDLKEVIAWVISGTLDEKRLLLISELLASDGKLDAMAQEIRQMIEEMDPETLADLNNKKLLSPQPLMEQFELQIKTRKQIDAMA